MARQVVPEYPSMALTEKIMQHSVLFFTLSSPSMCIGRIKAIASTVWPEVEVHMVGEKYILAISESIKGKEEIIGNLPWVFHGILLCPMEWSPLSRTFAVQTLASPTWVWLETLKPEHASDQRCIEALASLFPQFIEQVIVKDGGRSEARIKVVVDLKAPIIPGAFLKLPNRREYLVFFRYENLPPCCYCCGLMGHTDTMCGGIGADKHASMYGDWMFFTEKDNVDVKYGDVQLALPNMSLLTRKEVKRKAQPTSSSSYVEVEWDLERFSKEELRKSLASHVGRDKFNRFEFNRDAAHVDDNLIDYIFTDMKGPNESDIVTKWEVELLGRSEGDSWINCLRDAILRAKNEDAEGQVPRIKGIDYPTVYAYDD